MPISPKEAASSLDGSIEAQVSRAYDVIDEYLTRHWYTGCSSLVISPPELHEKARGMVLQEYRSKGWSITCHHDQREGVSWQFKGATS